MNEVKVILAATFNCPLCGAEHSYSIPGSHSDLEVMVERVPEDWDGNVPERVELNLYCANRPDRGVVATVCLRDTENDDPTCLNSQDVLDSMAGSGFSGDDWLSNSGFPLLGDNDASPFEYEVA